MHGYMIKLSEWVSGSIIPATSRLIRCEITVSALAETPFIYAFIFCRCDRLTSSSSAVWAVRCSAELFLVCSWMLGSSNQP